MKRFDWGELIVPAAMVAFALAYWQQAATLSFAARFFPALLTGVMVLCLVLALIPVLRRSAVAEAPAPGPSPVTVLRRIAVVAVPAAAFWLLWQPLGGTLTVTLVTPLLALLLGERRPLVLALLAGLGALLVEGLFIRVLYARIPDGLLGQIF